MLGEQRNKNKGNLVFNAAIDDTSGLSIIGTVISAKILFILVRSLTKLIGLPILTIYFIEYLFDQAYLFLYFTTPTILYNLYTVFSES